MSEQKYIIADDHWSSDPLSLRDLRAELQSYVAELDDDALIASVNEGLEIAGDPADESAAEDLLAHINHQLDAGSNSLVLRKIATEQRKQRTITLTGRAPVKIYEDEWPLVASAAIRPGAMDHGTPVPNYQTDAFTLRVRRHADGRTLVYGVTDAATAWTGTEDRRGGKLLAAGEDIAAAIRVVAEDCNMPEPVIRSCIADLPAEEI